jgi:glycosyltransferase involved in cell wall biosynthesis
MLGLIDYWMYRLNPNKRNKLGMCILIKDEQDIIEDNIRFHAAAGVDCFVVTDNNSTDGTREILVKLSKEFEIIIIDELSTDFLQAAWTTSMVSRAKYEQKADWVLCCDADEFWVPKNGRSLKDVFKGGASIINCERKNMVMPEAAINSNYDYLDTSLKVVNPVLFSKQSNAVLSQSSLSLSVAKVGDKVAVNTHGIVRVKAGNHNAKHWWKWSRIKTDKVEVYHYPFRAFSRFECQVKNILGNISGGKAELGQHAYRWKEQYEKGQLEDEYNRLIISSDDEKTLRKFGILVDDNLPGEVIKSARKA